MPENVFDGSMSPEALPNKEKAEAPDGTPKQSKAIAEMQKLANEIGQIDEHCRALRAEIDAAERKMDEKSTPEGSDIWNIKQRESRELGDRLQTLEKKKSALLEKKNALKKESSVIETIEKGKTSLTGTEVNRIVWHRSRNHGEMSDPDAGPFTVFRITEKNGYRYQALDEKGQRYDLDSPGVVARKKEVQAETNGEKTKELEMQYMIRDVVYGDPATIPEGIQRILAMEGGREALVDRVVSHLIETDYPDERAIPFVQASMKFEEIKMHPKVLKKKIDAFKRGIFDDEDLAAISKAVTGKEEERVDIALELWEIAQTSKKNEVTDETLKILVNAGNQPLHRFIGLLESGAIDDPIAQKNVEAALMNIKFQEDKDLAKRLENEMSMKTSPEAFCFLLKHIADVDDSIWNRLPQGTLGKIANARMIQRFDLIDEYARRHPNQAYDALKASLYSVRGQEVRSSQFNKVFESCVAAIALQGGENIDRASASIIEHAWYEADDFRLTAAAALEKLGKKDDAVRIRNGLKADSPEEIERSIKDVVLEADDQKKLAIHDEIIGTDRGLAIRILRVAMQHESEGQAANMPSTEELEAAIVQGFREIDNKMNALPTDILLQRRMSEKDSETVRIAITMEVAKLYLSKGWEGDQAVDLAMAGYRKNRSKIDELVHATMKQRVLKRVLEQQPDRYEMAITLATATREERDDLLLSMKPGDEPKGIDLASEKRRIMNAARRKELQKQPRPAKPEPGPIEKEAPKVEQTVSKPVQPVVPVEQPIQAATPEPAISTEATSPEELQEKTIKFIETLTGKMAELKEEEEDVGVLCGRPVKLRMVDGKPTVFIANKEGSFTQIENANAKELNDAIVKQEVDALWKETDIEVQEDPYAGKKEEIFTRMFEVDADNQLLDDEHLAVISNSLRVMFRNVDRKAGDSRHPMQLLGIIDAGGEVDSKRAAEFKELFKYHTEDIRGWNFADLTALTRLWNSEGGYRFATLTELRERGFYA